MKQLVFLLSLILLSCSEDGGGNRRALKILDSSGNLLLEDRNAKQLKSDVLNTILIEVSDKKLLSSITTSKVGEALYVKLDNKINQKFIVAGSLDNGIIQLNIGGGNGDMFQNEEDAVKNLHNFD